MFNCTTCKCELHIVYMRKHKPYCYKHALMNGWKAPVLVDVTRTTRRKRNAPKIKPQGVTVGGDK